MSARRALIPITTVLCVSALAGCASSEVVGSANKSQSPIPAGSGNADNSSASDSTNTSAISGGSYTSLAELEAALSAANLPCADAQTASTAGISGALATAVCLGGRKDGENGEPNVRLILFNSHTDAVAWQDAMGAGDIDAYYVIGGNWGVASPASLYGLFVVSSLGGAGLSPSASPGVSPLTAPP